MEATLQNLVPRITQHDFEVFVFAGKQQLQRNLGVRLRAYARWLPKDWRIVTLVDRDDDDCLNLKGLLEAAAEAAGLKTRSRVQRGHPFAVLNRIVIEELEAWYFGDWDAVRVAFPRLAAGIPSHPKYRDSDAIRGGTAEAFERLLKEKGYYPSGINKLEVAQRISPHMQPSRNRSQSFRVFHEGLLACLN